MCAFWLDWTHVLQLMNYIDPTVFETNEYILYMCQGLNSHCFPMVGMVINLIVGFYIPIIRLKVG